MRAPVFLLIVLAALATFGCSSSATSQKTGVDAGPFCPQPVGDCSTGVPGQPLPVAGWCTLSAATTSACMRCGGDGGCGRALATTGIVQGATYTYISMLDVDVGTIMVYDQAGALVAVLGWNTAVVCLGGPADFDPTEAFRTALSVSSEQSLQQMCASAGLPN
jgi:hypothetical protein